MVTTRLIPSFVKDDTSFTKNKKKKKKREKEVVIKSILPLSSTASAK